MSIDLNVELLKACKESSIDKVISVLEQGADINAKDESGQTALTIARSEGRTKIVKLLLSKSD